MKWGSAFKNELNVYRRGEQNFRVGRGSSRNSATFEVPKVTRGFTGCKPRSSQGTNDLRNIGRDDRF